MEHIDKLSSIRFDVLREANGTGKYQVVDFFQRKNHNPLLIQDGLTREEAEILIKSLNEAERKRPAKERRYAEAGFWIRFRCRECANITYRDAPKRIKGIERYCAPCQHCGDYGAHTVLSEKKRYRWIMSL